MLRSQKPEETDRELAVVNMFPCMWVNFGGWWYTEWRCESSNGGLVCFDGPMAGLPVGKCKAKAPSVRYTWSSPPASDCYCDCPTPTPPTGGGKPPRPVSVAVPYNETDDNGIVTSPFESVP